MCELTLTSCNSYQWIVDFIMLQLFICFNECLTVNFLTIFQKCVAYCITVSVYNSMHTCVYLLQRYDEELVVPIIENTPEEMDLAVSLTHHMS